MGRIPTSKNCRCITCRKWFHFLGIARHRAKHRNKKENCRITYSNGKTFIHYYGEEAKEE